MSSAELVDVLTENATRTGIEFADTVISTIVDLSAGYPHFAQLLGLKSAELAIGDGRRDVRPVDLSYALALAVDDAEESLRARYGEAVRSYQTQTYRVIVEAAAELPRTEFYAKELRDSVTVELARTVTQGEMNNHFHRLVSDDGTRILTREAKGVYRFSDPRMKSYVRIARRARQSSEDAND